MHRSASAGRGRAERDLEHETEKGDGWDRQSDSWQLLVPFIDSGLRALFFFFLFSFLSSSSFFFPSRTSTSLFA